jgi:hypothetical protein
VPQSPALAITDGLQEPIITFPILRMKTTATKQTVTRVQLDLPDERVKELETIMAKTAVSTRKDLFENALALFEWAVGQCEMGRVIGAIDREREGFHELLMPALASAKRKYEAKINDALQEPKT